MGYVMLMSDSIGLSYNFSRRCVQEFPDHPAAWHNIAKCYHEKQNTAKADEHFLRALKAKPDFGPSLEGLSMTSLDRGEFERGIEFANRALADNEDAFDARINRSMAYLALKRWKEGWRDYNRNIGREKNRKEIIYGDEPRWEGKKGQNVVCYTEQGIGDEIAFASVIPDLIRDSKHVTIECDGRVEGLFKRSFPQATVHGTRYKEAKIPEWRSKTKFDARVAVGKLAEFYRLNDSDFPGEPYFKPNPQMAMQWRVLLNSLGPKPKIGIAWSGGIPKTGYKRRSIPIDTLAPLFQFDADWISLQYKDLEGIQEAKDKYGVTIHDWDWGVRVRDYDQTAALISELDLVISVTTAVVDAAGALGKECWALVPQVPMWRFLKEGDWYPWAKSVKIYRQKAEWPIQQVLSDLRRKFDSPRNGLEQAKAA